MNEAVKKEFRVAFSKDVQPVWFRIVKWTIFLAISWRLWGTKWFKFWLGGISIAALTAHFTWRYKTRGWTQPWGGWDDVKAAQGRPSQTVSQ